MINARTKYMATLVAEAFEVQEYEASVSTLSCPLAAPYSISVSLCDPSKLGSLGRPRTGQFELITVANLCSNSFPTCSTKTSLRTGSRVRAQLTSSSTTKSPTGRRTRAKSWSRPARAKISSSPMVSLNLGALLLTTLGEKLKLKGKGVYFLRCTPPGKPITASGTNDNEVLFGEISENTVFTLNTIVNNVYKPLVDKLDGSDWGSCEPEQKKEFMQTFDRFAKEVREAILSLASNIVLDPYPA